MELWSGAASPNGFLWPGAGWSCSREAGVPPTDLPPRSVAAGAELQLEQRRMTRPAGAAAAGLVAADGFGAGAMDLLPGLRWQHLTEQVDQSHSTIAGSSAGDRS